MDIAQCANIKLEILELIFEYYADSNYDTEQLLTEAQKLYDFVIQL